MSVALKKADTGGCREIEKKREELKHCLQRRKEIQKELEASPELKEAFKMWRFTTFIDVDSWDNLIQEADTMHFTCVGDALRHCQAERFADKTALDGAKLSVPSVKDSGALAAKMHKREKVKITKDQLLQRCEKRLEFYRSRYYYRSTCAEATCVEETCGSSATARHAYQNIMNHDFDGILRPKLHDHYHYRHDDNIASAAGGYSGDYQPLISGEYNGIDAYGSGSSMLIGVVGVSSVVIIVMLLFCVCLAFVMGMYYGYSQKRAKEEMRWIDENRNET